MVDIVISEKLGGLVVAAVVTGGAIVVLKDSCGVGGRMVSGTGFS